VVIRKFFPSMDHEILKQRIARKIKDPGVLWLADLLIAHSNPQEPVCDWFPGDDLFTPSERRRGIPIGNQTSQFFANVYLDPLDHFVKERLGIKGYVRYVDDFLLFSDDKGLLGEAREAIREFLTGLRLRLHPKKNVVFPMTDDWSPRKTSGDFCDECDGCKGTSERGRPRSPRSRGGL
jgi:retron-type reverse transcriptase